MKPPAPVMTIKSSFLSGGLVSTTRFCSCINVFAISVRRSVLDMRINDLSMLTRTKIPSTGEFEKRTFGGLTFQLPRRSLGQPESKTSDEAAGCRMIVETSVKPERRFVRDGLPWVVGAAALAVYLATLNPWMTLSSLPQVARANGWDWQPMLSRPLLYLLTCPFGWLPERWVPVALNGFAALCACLTLAMLARSVALLPHDRVEQQRLLVQNQDGLLSLPNAWVPVVLATVALGLQMTFWENAIAATGEMLDLLLFAYVIRCLLEYRIQQRQSWLGRAAFVFGAAIANNWAMAGFLPLFVVALFRFRGLSLVNFHSLPIRDQDGEQSAAPGLAAESRPLFYPTESGDGLKVDVIRVKAESRFLLRMTLLGLAGLSLFLVLPLVQKFSPDSGLSFWQALHTAAASYKTTLQLFFGRFLWHNRDIALLLAAVSLLPVLLLSIRWSGSGFSARPARGDFAPLLFPP